MTYDEWVNAYKPVPNPTISEKQRESASYNGTLFETFGSELVIVKEANPMCIWALIDNNDDDSMWISSGYHRVNRMGYFITEVPYTECVDVSMD